MKIENESKIVVDASVIGAIFFQEPEAEFAEKRLANRQWVAPTLLDYEMGSIFLKKIKIYPKLKEQLEESYKLFNQTAIERVDIPIQSVVPIAKKLNLTVYDASYLWLARELGLELFTFDKALSTAWSKR